VVLPFANLSGDPEQDYFVDGITESLTTDLSRINGSFVIACNAAFTETEASVSTQRPTPILGRVYAIVRKLVAAGLGNSN
jgi:TolB-like protein